MRNNIITEILAERKRQDKIWDEQNHSPYEWLIILMEEVGEASKAALDTLGVNDLEYREELIHIAAVTIAAIESFDRSLNEGN
jgi:hypothetical protein